MKNKQLLSSKIIWRLFLVFISFPYSCYAITEEDLNIAYKEIGFKVAEPSLDEVARCQKNLCFVNLYLNKYESISENSLLPLFNKGFVSAILSMANTKSGLTISTIIDGCDFFPKNRCFEEIISIRQYVYFSDIFNKTMGCFAITGFDKNKFPMKFGITFAWDGERWRGLSSKKHLFFESELTYKSLMSNPCAKP